MRVVIGFDLSDPDVFAAALELDALTPELPRLVSQDILDRRMAELDRAWFLAQESRRNQWLNDNLGPGWYRRALEDEYVGRDGTVLSAESVRAVAG